MFDERASEDAAPFATMISLMELGEGGQATSLVGRFADDDDLIRGD